MIRVTLICSLVLSSIACTPSTTAGSASNYSTDGRPLVLKSPIPAFGVPFRADSSDPHSPLVICELERNTGSNFPEKVCRKVEDDGMNSRARTREALMRLKPEQPKLQ